MTTVTDDFNRANVAPLAAPWATGTGDSAMNLVSNAAAPSSTSADCAAIYNGTGAPSWGDDQSSSAKLTVTGTAGSGPGVALWVRHAAAAKTGYRLAGDHAATNNFKLNRFSAGTGTSLVIFTQAFTDGDRFELRVTGPATAARIEILRNGASVQVFTDNSTIASGAPGIGFSSIDTSASLDDWIGTDMLARQIKTPRAATFRSVR